MKNKRKSYEEVREMFLDDRLIEANAYLMTDLAGYLKEGNPQEILEMLSFNDKIEAFELLHSNAKLDADELFLDAEPYDVLCNLDFFIEKGIHPNHIAEKILEDEYFDIYIERDVFVKLLKCNNVDAKDMFDLCMSYLNFAYPDEEINDFIEIFKPYLEHSYLEQFKH